MNNLFDGIKEDPRFNKLKIGEFLFAEYTCPIESKKSEIWTEQDYLVHVVKGKKTWHTTDGSWVLKPGQTIFFRKGGALVEQHFEEDFCLLIFFVPDGIISEVWNENYSTLKNPRSSARLERCAIPVEHDLGLEAFLDSRKHCFSGSETPPEAMLRLKLKELILSIFVSKRNSDLASYLFTLARNEGLTVGQIMEANFRYAVTPNF